MNAAEVQRQLDEAGRVLVEETAPRAIARLVLDIRDACEANAPRGPGRAGSSRQVGDLASSWDAGQAVSPDYTKSGAEDARAALANPSLDKSFFVYTHDRVAALHEYDTVHMGATPMLGPAIQLVADRVDR